MKNNNKGGIVSVVEIIPRSQFEDSGFFDTNPSESVQFEVVEKTIDLRFGVTASSFKIENDSIVRSLLGLISKEEAQSLRSESNPNLDSVCILDAKVVGASCNLPNQDFRLGASFTKNSLKFVEYASPGALSSKIKKCVFTDEVPIYSVYIPASSGRDEFSDCFGSRLLEFPEPLPLMQGSNSVWHDAVKMYAGTTMKSVENTILKGKTTSATRSDSLVGFVIKSSAENIVFVADYKGDDEIPVFPVDAEMILKAPSFVFKNAVKTIGDHVQAMQKFANTKLSAVDFYLLCDTIASDYIECENGGFQHRETKEVIARDTEIELTVRLDLKLVYFHHKKTSTAMWVESAPVWIKDIWPRKSVNLTTGKIDKNVRSFAGTVAYKDRLEIDEERNQRARKRMGPGDEKKHELFGSSSQGINDDDEDIADGASVDVFNANHPSSSSSSSSSFYNPLVDDTI